MFYLEFFIWKGKRYETCLDCIDLCRRDRGAGHTVACHKRDGSAVYRIGAQRGQVTKKEG